MDPSLIVDGIRMASLEEIIAMKIDVVQRIGRKKDFWDIYEVLPHYSVADMIALLKRCYEYSHDEALIRNNFTNFADADNDFEPICLRGRYWELIKEDISQAVTDI